MTSPLQRAANGLHDEFCRHEPCFGFEHHSDPEREVYREAARAVILAIREPSEGMAEAVRGTALEPCFPESDWRRMIDALLAEK